jgi:hypothetical protein
MTVRAPLTAAFDVAEAIELTSPARSYRAPRAAVRVYHRPETLAGE